MTTKTATTTDTITAQAWETGEHTVAAVPCECGQILGEPCRECFPPGDIVVVEHMPQHLRASHEAARNRGTYPANGAVRLRCYIGHALMAVDSDPDWTEILELVEVPRG